MSDDRRTGISGEGETMGRERDEGRRVLLMNGGRQVGRKGTRRRRSLRSNKKILTSTQTEIKPTFSASRVTHSIPSCRDVAHFTWIYDTRMHPVHCRSGTHPVSPLMTESAHGVTHDLWPHTHNKGPQGIVTDNSLS